MTRDRIVELLAEDETVIFLEGPEFDKAILGLTERFGMPSIVAYDYETVLEVLEERGMHAEEAIEWFTFNILGAWMGEGTPCFIHTGDM